jgi:hypothetical protein
VAWESGSVTAKLCLKARPTPTQLGDRLRPLDGVWPEGLELYLAAADLADAATLDAAASRILAAEVPHGFAWLIEGPVDSLDGGDFDVTRDSPADLLVVERLAWLAERIGALAVNIHLIAPSPDLARLTLECRATLLEKSVPFLSNFVKLMRAAGAVPTIENMPPVLRMRRSDFSFTPIGMASADLEFACAQVPGLRTLGDTSHAGLYLNARRGEPDPDYAWSAPLRRFLDTLPLEDGLGHEARRDGRDAVQQGVDGASDGRHFRADADPRGQRTRELFDYFQALPELENAQISNAAGVLGEGLRYGEGDFDLDPVIGWLKSHSRHIVTETLESDNNDAVTMREALRCMRAVDA